MLGTIQVSKPSGMDVLNNSINTLANDIPRDEWKMVSVAVAPSTITISFVDGGEPPLDCRVRFLSFLGIGQESAQYCAFIVHTAQVVNKFSSTKGSSIDDVMQFLTIFDFPLHFHAL